MTDPSHDRSVARPNRRTTNGRALPVGTDRWSVPDYPYPHAINEIATTANPNPTRFQREVGVTPMEYLLGWRMALAKDLLRRDGIGVAQVAQQVGYSSASTFSVAFTRHVGMPPAHYARTALQAAE